MMVKIKMKSNYITFFLIILLILVNILFLYQRDKCTITFVVDNEIYKTTTVEKGKKITFPDQPTKDGYAFIGWYKDEYTLLDSTMSASQNEVYYARWAIIETN